MAAAPAPAPAARPQTGHGLPGRLIVVEGLDGSGKSTQMELLKQRLQEQGLKVVATTWNSSAMLAEAVKRAKRSRRLTPETFALLQAADLADRVQHVILPALREGAVVLADRWFFTALARDATRGMDPAWLRTLYSAFPRPDLTLYFRLPVETAIGRVLNRAEKKLKLSENADLDLDQARPEGGPQVSYYEAGLDLGLSADPVENFRLFQERVAARYDAMVPEFGLRTIDATRPREEQEPEVAALAAEALGDLSAYARDEAHAAPGVFDKDPSQDSAQVQENYRDKRDGDHFYFRNMLLPMQARFAELVEHAGMPRVFLHGNPHVDNYAKTQRGASMADFDRSRYGPYAWDLVRLMVSLSLRQKHGNGHLLDDQVLASLLKGYVRGFKHPERGYEQMKALREVEPEADERSTKAYAKAERKWVREMRESPLPADHPDVLALVEGYARRHEPGLLQGYEIKEAGRGKGSMGFRDIVLVLLKPKDKASGLDWVLLNFKEVRADPDSEWYKNPFDHHGERMIAAHDLYAPGWELRQGYLTHGERQYHVRQIPPQNAKLKRKLDSGQLADLAFAAGTQLGRGHRLSLQTPSSPDDLLRHLGANFGRFVEAGLTLRDEVVAAHQRYLKKLRERQGPQNG